MAEARISIIGAESGVIFDSFDLGEDKSSLEHYRECLKWVDRYAVLSILKYAKITRDFRNRTTAEVYIKEDAMTSSPNLTFRA